MALHLVLGVMSLFFKIMTITINKKKYNVKYTIRALFLFEQITGKPFEIKTLLDHYIFFYSMVLANNPDKTIQWDEFIDALDNDKKLLEQLNNFMNEQQKQDKVFANDDSEDPSKKK